MNDLHIKYRPNSLEEIIGQKPVVDSLSSLFEAGRQALPHAFLFSGNRGVGKTTLARIVAKFLGCKPYQVLEVDAATHTGIDNIRELTKDLDYRFVGDNPTKFIIIDECHRLTGNAWDALLKIMEEPPDHVYFALCTTEPGKVPETIKSRCHKYFLKDISKDDILDLLEYINEEEKISLPLTFLLPIASAAQGSARDAIVGLSMCRGCKTKEDVAAVLSTPFGSIEVITLCKALIERKLTWPKLREILLQLKETNPESVRIQICNYLAKVILNQPGPKEAERILYILSRFSTPFNPQTGFSDLLLSIGDLLFNSNGSV